MEYSEAITDYKKIMEDPEVEAVVICAPAAAHGDLIMEAANAGKHVFCEKPFDYDIAKIVKAMKVVEECKVKLQLGFNRRFDHNFAKAHEYVKAGKIGDVHVIKITSRDPFPPAPGYFTAPGGEHCSIYTDTTIHDFDMARFLNNCEVVEVYAMGSKLINKDKPEIFGTKGAVTVENDIFSQATLNAREGIIAEKPLVTIKDRYGAAYAEEVRQFVLAVQNDTPTLATGMDGLMSIVIADAARKSTEENRPVKISELMPKL